MRAVTLAILVLIATTELPAQSIDRIMFGSCLDETREHTALAVAVDRNPDLFVFLGDNVYADSDDPALIRRSYELLGGSPLFQALRGRARRRSGSSLRAFRCLRSITGGRAGPTTRRNGNACSGSLPRPVYRRSSSQATDTLPRCVE